MSNARRYRNRFAEAREQEQMRDEYHRMEERVAELEDERDRLREALEKMPAITIALRTPQELEMWDSWKRATFNPDGSVRTALQEAGDE